MYVRKDLGLNLRTFTLISDCVVGLTNTINTHPVNFLNVCFSHNATLFSFLPTCIPSPDFYIVGDFNCHHNDWYGPASIDYADLIRNASIRSSALLQWVKNSELHLHNTSGVFTHFPRNSNRPPIVDQSFSPFENGSLVTSWPAPNNNGHGSDHTYTSCILNIALPFYTPRRLTSKCIWGMFSQTITSVPTPGPPTSASSALALCTSVQELLELAIDKSTAWSTPGKHSIPWCNTQLTLLRRRLAWAKRLGRAPWSLLGPSRSLFNLRREFKNALRQARFLFWDQKTCHNDSAAAWKQLFQATKPLAKPALPDFGTNGSFDAKFHALRLEFFPTAIHDLPDLPPGWCCPPLLTSTPPSTRLPTTRWLTSSAIYH